MDLCVIVLLTIYPQLQSSQVREFRRAQVTCESVYYAAQEHSTLDPLLALAVAAEETRFKPRKSNKGAQGPLQVMPEYWCPKDKRGKLKPKCDHVRAGLRALEHYVDKRPSLRRALEAYAGAGPSARAYAERVLVRLKTLQAVALALEGDDVESEGR